MSDPNANQSTRTRLEELEREVERLRAGSAGLRKAYDLRLTFHRTFWDDVIAIGPQEWAHARQQRWPDHVVLERWATHDSIKVWERIRGVSADGQRPVVERPMDVYVDPRRAGRRAISLESAAVRLIDVYSRLPLLKGVLVWDLWLEGPDPSRSVWEQKAPRIQLRVDGFNFQLSRIGGRLGEPMYLPDDDYPHAEQVLVEIPLSEQGLEVFSRPAESESDDRNRYEPDSSLMCYQGALVDIGVEWQLWIHDFTADA